MPDHHQWSRQPGFGSVVLVRLQEDVVRPKGRVVRPKGRALKLGKK